MRRIIALSFVAPGAAALSPAGSAMSPGGVIVAACERASEAGTRSF